MTWFDPMASNENLAVSDRICTVMLVCHQVVVPVGLEAKKKKRKRFTCTATACATNLIWK